MSFNYLSIVTNNVFVNKNKTLILLILFLLMICLILFNMENKKKLDQTNKQEYNQNSLEQHELIEGFKNKLEDFMDSKSKKRREKFYNKQSKESEVSKLLNRLSKAEDMYDMNDRSMDHFKNKIREYYRSFNKERFTSTPKNTRLSLEKFKHFKESFWDIFKD